MLPVILMCHQRVSPSLGTAGALSLGCWEKFADLCCVEVVWPQLLGVNHSSLKLLWGWGGKNNLCLWEGARLFYRGALTLERRDERERKSGERRWGHPGWEGSSSILFHWSSICPAGAGKAPTEPCMDKNHLLSFLGVLLYFLIFPVRYRGDTPKRFK